ncbi:P-loop containing nucleoside triphosphate hydrolase protein [Cucurbitaria berberidis CBS 394.84]|uniref:P-loop containing nucleoside triphosphate hydrolase protein n=1 Tax=Cucurbitaria berberidis CBS 394.84 TaxID=1168544 RepID=A0A9P4LBN0_9PLEO|nr:P-loop containing nucleoside triphosphate hydrolase protein [Cucurbitaria berberidis CBS 394.84]KAF1848738.1 P-loop containing nucleoside triphosphate hydrolase protein [Cucurbitaria berberidis CBS 394.84]
MASNSTQNCASVDDTFGPYAGEQCRGGFDFTLLFGEVFLSILPLALLLGVAPFRIVYLWGKHIKLSRSSLLYTKLIAWTLLASFDLALLVIWAKRRTQKHRAELPSAVISFVGALVLGLLSFYEHLRSIRPSFLLNVYLLFTVFFDVTRSRSYALSPDLDLIANIFATRVAVKVFLAIFEARGKRMLLLPEFADCPPEATSGVYKRTSFWWLNELFKKGFSNSLTVDDLFHLDKHLKADYLHHSLGSAWDRLTRASPHSLFVATLKKLRWHILAVVPPRLCLIAFNFCQPFLIHRAVNFSQQSVTPQTTNIGYGLIGAYVLVFVGIAVSTGQYMHSTFRFITMMRGGLVSMLYSKATDIALTDVDVASSLTLMSADVERIVTGMETGHEIWSNTLEIALAMYLLEQQLGVACAIPIGVAVVSLLGSLGVTSLIMQRQALWLEAIERRIAATNAMLNSMKGVKMCGLTDVLRDDLQQLRVDELNISKKFRKLLIWTMGFSYISPIVAPILAFAVFSILAQKSGGASTLDTATVFTSLSLFTLLTEPLGSLIMALSALMGGIGSFKRIQEFISTKARTEKRKFPSTQSSVAWVSDIGSESEKVSDASQKSQLSLEVRDGGSLGSQAIVIENGYFGWDKERQSLGTLQAINMVVPRGKITMVVGPVGCGKSTLLKAVLGELPLMGGTLQVSSLRIALCDQTAWHVNGTVQESIIGVSDFDQRWYSSVVRGCALDEDLRQLPQGDQTQIGSKGIALSGGQSQRIALARAVYAQKDIVILDDCLSGLDGQTENRIWHSLFGHEGLLKRCRTTVLIASSSAKRLPYCDHIVALDKEGKIIEQGTFEKLNISGGYVSGFDLPPPDWEFTLEKHIYEAPPKYTERQTSSKVTEDDIQAEANRRTGDIAIYLYYIGSVGWIPTIIFIVSMIIFIFGISFPSIWVKMWAEYNERFPNQRLGYYLGIYAMLGGLALFFLIVSCWQLIITMVPRSGVIFHQKLLDTVLGSPMSFFSTTDTGVTLNRFSQDLMLIDMELPVAALNTFATFVLCISQMALIAVAAPFAAISFPVVGISVYFIQKFYLRTSRQLRFLDLETKSPLYTQFSEILEGLATIRAFGWQSFVEDKAKALLDRSQRPFYLLFAVQRWLTFVLDLVVAAVATILIILVVALRGKLSAGYVGVALLNVVLFSQSIKLLISFWTQLETHIGSVARIKNFTTDAVTEDQENEDHIPPPNWPSAGKIEFKNIEAYHRPGEPVISDFSLSIKAGEKVAIVGRTGSGKSSLVLSLFRMIELSAGSITIDSLPLHRVPRQTIRSRLIGLPQDAYLLPGSVRLNADPLKQSHDKAIMQALKDVQLWDVIVAKGDVERYAHPLDVEVEDLHFSHGQRQLFCLARALLRREKASVVVLDEATSNLDHATDSHVQRLLRSKFPSHTLIAVAHKLDTVLDFDKVVVMNQGQLVEYGEPYKLLERQGSWFKSLYEEVNRIEGPMEDEDIMQIAQ